MSQARMDIGAFFVMLSVVGLTVVQLSMIRGALSEVAAQPPIESDDEFFRHTRVLGPEFEIFDWVRSNLPTGTAIAVDFADTYDIETLRRITRMWLALLPQYPIREVASYRICAREDCKGLEVGASLVEGERLLLLQTTGD